jgi:hypothetical protein
MNRTSLFHHPQHTIDKHARTHPMFCVRRCAASSICLKTAGGTMVGGPSSKIFWKRRCVLLVGVGVGGGGRIGMIVR